MKVIKKDLETKETVIQFENNEKWLLMQIFKITQDNLTEEGVYGLINSRKSWTVTVKGD